MSFLTRHSRPHHARAFLEMANSFSGVRRLGHAKPSGAGRKASMSGASETGEKYHAQENHPRIRSRLHRSTTPLPAAQSFQSAGRPPFGRSRSALLSRLGSSRTQSARRAPPEVSAASCFFCSQGLYSNAVDHKALGVGRQRCGKTPWLLSLMTVRCCWS